MTSARRFLSPLAVLLVAASVALADGMDDARRYLGFAKDLVDRNDRLEQAHEYLDKAEKALAPLPDGQKAALLADCKALRERAVAQKLAHDIRMSDQRLERDLSQVKEDAEGRGRNKLMSPDDVEPIFARIEATLAAPEIQKVFDAAHKAEWQQKIDAYRGVALRTTFNNIYLEAEKWLVRVEEHNAGTSTHGYTDENIEGYLQLARKEIDKLPSSDKRRGEMDDRYKAASTANARRRAGDSKEGAIDAARELWKHQQRQHGSAADRWATENAFEFNTWWREHGRMNLDKTEAHFDTAADTMEDDRWATFKKHTDDKRVQELVAEVEGVAAEASKKIGLAADKLLAQAEGKIAESGATEVKERAESMLRLLVKVEDASPEGKAALERCRALINRCHEIEVNGSDPGASTPPPAPATAGGSPTPASATEAAEAPGPGPERVEAAPSLGLLPMLLGCGCCSLLLVAGGGGAFFMMKKQAAAKPPAP